MMVEQAKMAMDWEKFCKAAEHCGLKKVLTWPVEPRLAGLLLILLEDEESGDRVVWTPRKGVTKVAH